MRRRAVLVAILPFALLTSFDTAARAQLSDDATPNSAPLVIPPKLPEPAGQDEHLAPELTNEERRDAVQLLNELRGAARTAPDAADARLQLSEGLYRVGDFDAALDECQAAIKLEPGNARAHLHLGLILMAKQDSRAAATALMETLLLDPTLPHAHYSLGNVQYALGNVKAALLSYRKAIELQPYFPDARYRLALLLKVTGREQEAAQFLEEAAIGGIPQAQFFLGNAYKNGQGVEKNLAHAVAWWAKATVFGHQPAADALSKLRRQVLSADQPERRRAEALDAFRRYRQGLWAEYPDLTPTEPDQSLGVTLVQRGDVENGVAALLAEASALSEPALAELLRLYQQGIDVGLPVFDRRILSCFETTAADGFVPAKRALARIHARGLGVAPDSNKAKAALKGLAKQDAKALIDELGLR